MPPLYSLRCFGLRVTGNSARSGFDSMGRYYPTESEVQKQSSPRGDISWSGSTSLRFSTSFFLRWSLAHIFKMTTGILDITPDGIMPENKGTFSGTSGPFSKAPQQNYLDTWLNRIVSVAYLQTDSSGVSGPTMIGSLSHWRFTTNHIVDGGRLYKIMSAIKGWMGNGCWVDDQVSPTWPHSVMRVLQIKVCKTLNTVPGTCSQLTKI